MFRLFRIKLLVTVPIFWIRLLVTVPIILDQAVSECSGNFGSVGWLLFLFFGSGYQLLFLSFWIRLLVTSIYFGSGCWLLFPLFWVRLLVTVHLILDQDVLDQVPIILDQAVGYGSYYFGSGCWLLFPIF
jgi:hypothetical protein